MKANTSLAQSEVEMDLTELESRDCPSALIVSSNSFDPFPGYKGAIEMVSAGSIRAITADTIPHIKIYDGDQELASFYAYDPAFRGGVNLATDGKRVATGTDRGPPHVREFTIHGVEVKSFYQGSPESMSGVRVSYAQAVTDMAFVAHPEAPVQIYLDGGSLSVARGVSEIFAPFNVGITNRYPSQTSPQRIATVIFGGEVSDGLGGQAIIGGFFQQSEFASLPARVFSDSLTESQQIRAAAHEAAHLFGAIHSTDPRSIMFPSLAGGGTSFDVLNSRILTQRLGLRV
jgi:hypothetical protein